MTDSPSKANQAAMARRLLRSVDGGILSTISVDVPGYPFGSVTPFVTTHEGRAVIYVSGIAQHTKNMLADPRVSLTVAAEPRADTNRQALGRITVVGDAVSVPPEHVRGAGDRYFRLFPESRAYQGTHDFSFFWIEPRRVRHIAGFGQIFWVEPEDWLSEAPAWQAGEAGIVDHMNEDHADAVLGIARMLWGESPPGPAEAELVAVDPEGFHVRTDKGVLYGSFEERASTSEEIRAAFVQQARAARE